MDEEIDYYGMIPADVQLEKAVKQQKIVSEVNANAKSSKAFRELANKLIDKEDVTDRTKKFGISQLFSEILNNKL